jgi:hypothetical protein
MVPASLSEPRALAFDTRIAVAESAIRNIANAHLASLEPGVDFATRWQTSPSETVSAAASFGERFALDQSESSLLAPQALGSFDNRFSREGLSYEGTIRSAPVAVSRAAAPRTPTRAAASTPKRAPKTEIRLASASGTSLALGYAPAGLATGSGVTGSLKGFAPQESDPLADVDTSRTAIYDITSHTVYLPNGRRLEAHSGLGSHLDDPRSVTTSHIGATPPNVYDLKMRESLFHGVRAIRLIPRDDSKMYGRSGILAHSYMLGPSGQSNGCVSFSDYSAFLDAYLRGEVTSLVVVERLASAPSPKIAVDWFSNTLKVIFQRS